TRLGNHGGGAAGGERDRAAGARDDIGERSPPGARSNNGDTLEGHGSGGRGSLRSTASAAGAALGAVTSTSGQRACGGVSSVSVRPSARRSAPAQAIIAPLSVPSSGGGTTRAVPTSNAMRFSTLPL